MRGGALPLLAWATLLVVLLALNWVWEGRGIHVAQFAAAALTIYAAAGLLWLARHEAVRRGPPPAACEPEAIPEGSAAAVIVGLSLGCILFGLAWASFLIWFGAAVLVASLGRLVIELRAEHDSRKRSARGVIAGADGDGRTGGRQPVPTPGGQDGPASAGGGSGT